jgi:hypothetical protein
MDGQLPFGIGTHALENKHLAKFAKRAMGFLFANADRHESIASEHPSAPLRNLEIFAISKSLLTYENTSWATQPSCIRGCQLAPEGREERKGRCYVFRDLRDAVSFDSFLE